MLFPDTIIRSKRRTLALYVNYDGSLTVRAPIGMPNKVISDFCKKNEKALAKRIQQKRQIYNSNIDVIEYSPVLIFGVKKKINFSQSCKKISLSLARDTVSLRAKRGNPEGIPLNGGADGVVQLSLRGSKATAAIQQNSPLWRGGGEAAGAVKQSDTNELLVPSKYYEECSGGMKYQHRALTAIKKFLVNLAAAHIKENTFFIMFV